MIDQYCTNCGIHNSHASPSCLGHGTSTPTAQLDVPNERPVIDPTRTDEDLLEQFTREALERDYSDDASALIATERLAHLRDGGDGYGRKAVEAKVFDIASGEEIEPPADGSLIPGRESNLAPDVKLEHAEEGAENVHGVAGDEPAVKGLAGVVVEGNTVVLTPDAANRLLTDEPPEGFSYVVRTESGDMTLDTFNASQQS
jgi:hypothetical protein